MGDLIGSQLVSEVTRHLANRDDLTNSDIVVALNLSQTRMARAHDFEELEFNESSTFNITASAVSDKILPFSVLTNSNPREIYSFRIITNDGRSKKLDQLSVRTFDEVVPEPEFHSRGLPSVYTKWADRFELWKVPDEAYTWNLRGSKWPTSLDADDLSSASDLDKKDDLLIYLTVSYLYGALGEYERANRFFGIFSSVYKEAKLEDHIKPDLMIASRTIGDTGGGDRPWANPFVKRMS